MTPAQFRRIRGAQALSQSELAALLGVHTQTVSKMERGAMPITTTTANLMHALATGWRPPAE